jgi:hypothetical protein
MFTKWEDKMPDGTTTVGVSLIPVEEMQKMEAATQYLESVRELSVTNDEEAQNANEVIRTVKKTRSELDARRKEIGRPYYDKYKQVNDEYARVLTALDNGAKVISRGLIAWQREEERKRREAEAKARAEAEEKRRKAEEKARAEAAKADTYREQGREEMAEKADARAESHFEAATTTVSPVVPQKKLAGASFVKKYVAEMKDMDKAVAFCMARPELRQFVSIDLKGLERIQNAAKGNLKVEGVEFKEDMSLRNR